ncbi:hypothetical protein [Bradyrhizobium sp. Ghvi]|nr:hypothetical protein [Bradyrhizobium sp. Ghvi]
MLMHADNGGIDHLDIGIMGNGKRFYDAAPTPVRGHLRKRI